MSVFLPELIDYMRALARELIGVYGCTGDHCELLGIGLLALTAIGALMTGGAAAKHASASVIEAQRSAAANAARDRGSLVSGVVAGSAQRDRNPPLK